MHLLSLDNFAGERRLYDRPNRFESSTYTSALGRNVYCLLHIDDVYPLRRVLTSVGADPENNLAGLCRQRNEAALF